ncbi:MAG TPA: hypothetical protein VJQ44_15865 [Gemmatimonadales bacterium]|nr:hypothetical protein [Gemmatimonadales bacterium]
MYRFFTRPRTSRLTAVVAAVGVMLAGCSEESPVPSAPDDPIIIQAASAGSLISVDPRKVNIVCTVNEFCGFQVSVSSSAPVTLDWGLDAGGILLASGQSCPVASNFFGECTIDLVVDTSHPARYTGQLRIGNLDTDTYKIYRVSARVR